MKNVRGLIAGVILLSASCGIVLGLYGFVRFWMEPPPGPGRPVFYEVKSGTTPMAIAQELETLGIITNSKMFYWYGRLTGKLHKFKSGDYRFTTKMKPDEVMNVIISGISFGYPLTVPEGYNSRQIAENLDKLRPGAGAEFLALCGNAEFIKNLGLFRQPPNHLEGFLFPDTYFITRKTPVSELIAQMVKRYRTVFTASLEAQAAQMHMTEFEVVTLASVVEKETGVAEERPLVASVFHNRLKKRMKLQSDPTVVYGLVNYNGNITKKDLLTPHPYNTYVIPGLPVGPIANPGKEAILATLSPATSDYLYFVSHNDGTHQFSTNYDDHRKAVNRFQVDPQARQGHSWREQSRKTKAH